MSFEDQKRIYRATTLAALMVMVLGTLAYMTIGHGAGRGGKLIIGIVIGCSLFAVAWCTLQWRQANQAQADEAVARREQKREHHNREIVRVVSHRDWTGYYATPEALRVTGRWGDESWRPLLWHSAAARPRPFSRTESRLRERRPHSTH
jgi:hypothetical protein